MKNFLSHTPRFLVSGTVRPLICGLLTILSPVCFAGNHGQESASSRKPNIVLILIDDLGYRDVGPTGRGDIDTPHIDQLAREGMTWTNAYSASPVCSPTRAALMSGKSPARVHFSGHITAIGRHRHPADSRIIPPDDLMDLPHEEISLAEVVKPSGYRSISLGKWHIGREGFWPESQGFDVNVGGWTHGSPPSHFYPYRNDSDWNASIPTLAEGKRGEYLTDRLTDETISFMQESKDQPFLVYLSHYAVHTPLQAPEDLVRKYENRFGKDGPVDPTYAAMVEAVDNGVGRIMAALRSLDLEQSTMVIFASDNGADARYTDNRPFREGKGHLYEGGIRVPLIIRWPGHIVPGTLSDTLTTSEDLFSTISDVVPDALKGTGLDGISLVPDFSHDFEDRARTLYWYYPHYSPHKNAPGAAIREGNLKLIESYDPVFIELYDLSSDPGETRNIADDFPAAANRLQEKLNRHLVESGTIMPTPNPAFKQ
jgi:arylsulfatase A-like enzyme